MDGVARLALAYRRYSLDYVDEEADAQAAWRGVWAGEFVKPWEWRRGKRLGAGGEYQVSLIMTHRDRAELSF